MLTSPGPPVERPIMKQGIPCGVWPVMCVSPRTMVIPLSPGDVRFISDKTSFGRTVIPGAQTQGWLSGGLPFGASHSGSEKINRDCRSRDP